MGILAAQLLHKGIHQCDKTRDASAADIVRDNVSGFIRAVHHHAVKQVEHADLLAFLDADKGAACSIQRMDCIIGGGNDGCFQVSAVSMATMAVVILVREAGAVRFSAFLSKMTVPLSKLTSRAISASKSISSL